MASAISPLSAANGDTQSAPAPAANSNSAIGSKDMFLRLLVSQIKNQDPLNPMDGTAFVAQLAQFSQLEAILGMRSDLQAVVQAAADGGAAPADASTTPPTT